MDRKLQPSCPGTEPLSERLPLGGDDGSDFAAAVADRHDVARHLRVEDGNLFEEVDYAVRDGAGGRQRRRTVQVHGLAALEMEIPKSGDRVANDLVVLCRLTEGEAEQNAIGVRLGGNAISVSHTELPPTSVCGTESIGDQPTEETGRVYFFGRIAPLPFYRKWQ